VTVAGGEHRTSETAVENRAVCVECGCTSDPLWRGWLAYRVDDPETDPNPELGFYCPACAAREFGFGKR
jgi:hypothetical protein